MRTVREPARARAREAARSRAAALILAPLALLALVAARCGAQDFASPALAGPAVSPLALIESGLPSAATRTSLAASATRWFALPELATRSLGIGGSWRGACAAFGLSQTGDPELGWTALGLALGGASPRCGGALRAVARRDRLPGAEPGPLGPGAGLEAGAGAWADAGAGLTLWASAPQVWLRGAAPPLARGLELGAALRAGDGGLWLLRRAPARDADDRAGHEAGLAFGLGVLSAWARARDGPLRASIGLAARARLAEASAEVSSHPVLGETVSISIAVPARRDPAAPPPRPAP
jgi:hypothetical protein